jgi:hypothetical protein
MDPSAAYSQRVAEVIERIEFDDVARVDECGWRGG